jgi:hypothetical protein
MTADKNPDFQSFLDYASKKEGSQCLCAVFCHSAADEIDRLYTSGKDIMPVMCVDKSLHRLTQFKDLTSDPSLIGIGWDLVCISVLIGRDGMMPTAIETNKRLDVMLELIRRGNTSKLVMFDREGRHVKLETLV